MPRFDLVIIGGGAAGFSAAVKASELTDGKATIAMINAGPLGGTCVNVGCVPSKYLLEISHASFYPLKRPMPGVSYAKGEVDFAEAMGAVRRLVAELREEKYKAVLRHYGNVELIEGRASFVSPKEVSVGQDGGSKKIEGKKFIIATGSRPSAPPIEGLREAGYVDSDTIWSMDRQPASLLVIGAGAVGLELGQALQHLGSDVTVVEALDRILPGAEPEVSEVLEEALAEEGMKFIKKARVASVSGRPGEGKDVDILSHAGRATLRVDEILVASGRKANTDGLNLEAASVKVDGRGFILVDSLMRTSNPNIYAAGDVVSKKLMLETLSAREGAIAAINALGNGEEKIDYTYVPSVVFTHPNAATVGLGEREVSEKYGACSCTVIGPEHVAKARMTGEKGVAKIVIRPDTGQIAGIHVVAPYAAEFIAWGALAMKMGMRARDLLDAPHVFPSFAELLKLGGQSFFRPLSRMPCCVE